MGLIEVIAAAFLVPALAVQFTPSLKALALATAPTGVALLVGGYVGVTHLPGGDHGMGAAFVMVLFMSALAGLAAGAFVRAGILVITYALRGPRSESSGGGDQA